MRLLPILLLFAALSPSAAHAFSTDPATGFGIRPPAPFVAEQTTNRRQFDVGVGIKSTTGAPPTAGPTPYVCEAGFKAAAQNNGLSREEINAFMDKPEWVSVARATMELVFKITSQQRFTLEGYRGIEFRAQPKEGPGAENVRMHISIVETARGRSSLFCVTEKAAFAKALPQFRAIRATISLPK
jgi:hypothetical protein